MTPPDDALLAAKRGALRYAFESRIAGGRVFNGVNYQIDPQSQVNICVEGDRAAQVLANVPGVTPWPQGYYWIATDNSHTPMDAPAVFAFAQNCGSYVRALIFNNRALKDAINAAADQATLDAIDLTAGWPSNP